MFQRKEKDNILKEELIEMEISHLPDKKIQENEHKGAL